MEKNIKQAYDVTQGKEIPLNKGIVGVDFHKLAEHTSDVKKNTWKRKFDESNESDSQRHCLQLATESFSLLFMFVGFTLMVVTPWFLLAIFTFPGPHSKHFQTALWICCIVSIVCVILGSYLGNMVWFYDSSKPRWSFFLHCGTAKSRRKWGDSFKNKDDVIVAYL